jgi:hypothetical protein
MVMGRPLGATTLPPVFFLVGQMVMGKFLGLTTPMYSNFKKHIATVDQINSAKIDRRARAPNPPA